MIAANPLRLLAALLVSAMSLAAVPASAETWQLQYVGLLGRVPLLTADLEVSLANEGGGIGAFHASALAATDPNGAGALIPFRMQLETAGGRPGPALAPLWHRSLSTAWQQQQRVELDYGADGSVATFVDPPTHATNTALDGGLVSGTIDPVTAGLILIDQVMRAGGCAGSLAVFDGIRRYDLAVIASEAGTPPARISGTAGPGHGTAVACRMSIGYRSGFPADASRSSFYPKEITIWLAPLANQAQVVPVLATADLAVGQLRLELLSVMAVASAN
jgi:hypothetical protein